MQIKILFRKNLDTEEEFKIAQKYFDLNESRISLKDSLVVGRYSVLPYYQELEKDLEIQGSKLINSYEQHRYIADFEYYNDISDLTPKTYFKLEDIPDSGPFIVKGKTNSRKFAWNRLMFAENRQRAIEIACDLKTDSLIYLQDIIVRDFVKLNVLEEGIEGLPFSNEWRFFCFKDKILSYGFYWTISEKKGTIDALGVNLVETVIKRVKDKVNFFVVDIAQKADGDWIVIEMNDGQQSGLSGNDPEMLYHNLKIFSEI